MPVVSIGNSIDLYSEACFCILASLMQACHFGFKALRNTENYVRTCSPMWNSYILDYKKKYLLSWQARQETLLAQVTLSHSGLQGSSHYLAFLQRLTKHITFVCPQNRQINSSTVSFRKEKKLDSFLPRLVFHFDLATHSHK